MLDWTGERYLPFIDPSISGAEVHYEHLHRYAFAAQFVKGKRVLDLASGEGYGTYLLSKNAHDVVGIEIDHETVNHAQNTYKKDNIEFKEGSILNIPIDGEKIFDIIVCFEAIEHVKEHDILLQEIKRLIKDDGLLIISTPNKEAYSDVPGYHNPGYQNPFHQKELYYAEFYDLLKKNFPYIYLYGQKVFSGSSIYPMTSKKVKSCSEFVIARDEQQFSFKEETEKIPVYFIAFASNKKLEENKIQKSFLIDKSDLEITLLNDKINVCQASIKSLEQAVNGKDQQLQLITTNIQLLDQVLTARDLQLKENTAKVLSLEQELSARDLQLKKNTAKVLSLEQELSARDLQIQERTARVRLMEAEISPKDQQLQDLTRRVLSLEQKISSIERSIVWQFTMKFHNKIVERLLPQNTRRRKYYDLGRAGGKILINDGYSAFCQSFTLYFHKNNELSDYHWWIKKNEPTPAELIQLKDISQNFSYRPKISIITPVWNTDKKWLCLAIESVINQVYDNWELCIADGSSTKRYIQQILKKYAQKDPRIKVKFLEENKGIAGNSNEALALATGEFIGFLDHDDELAPFALHEVVSLLNQNQNFEFIYSDEDKIDQSGNRKDPFFKPDWSPDLFLSQNYLCHFSVIRKMLIDSIGGFRTGYDGSQDYDLFLRCTEKVTPATIAHISKVLYHWRIIQGSAADHIVAKPYAITSAIKALEDALIRRSQQGKVIEGLFSSSYRVCYAIRDYPQLSIIIPTKDHVGILKRCIQSILDKTTYQNYEIVIIDNQSTKQETFEYYKSFATNPQIKILHYDRSFNFSAINNYAVTQVDSPYILFLNDDTEVISEEWLSAMLEHAQRDCVGAVGAKLLYPNNLIQHAGVILGITGTSGQKGVAGHSHKYLSNNYTGGFLRSQIIGNYSAVTAACLMMRKEVFKEIGGFNEDLAIAFNDVDLCLRIRNAGYLIVYTPYSQLYHHESLSRGYENTPEKQARFSKEVMLIREQWGAVIDKGDPYYNPNLTLEKEDFSIDSKGRYNE